jgi:hypothetical protein
MAKDLFNQEEIDNSDLIFNQPPSIYENSKPEPENWSIPDKDGNINIPDELDPLFNKLGFQLRFHTISGKNEIATIASMCYIAQKFFNELNNKKNGNITIRQKNR